jgi:predicted extracellular nuclease
MYTGLGAEFIEFTNLDSEPVDLTGWSYDDESREPGKVDLSAFGVVAPGQSVVVTEATVPAFQADWHGLVGVSVVGNVADASLGGQDEINLYDPSAALVDRLTYGHNDFPGSVYANEASGWPCASGLGVNNIYRWWRSAVGDSQGSVQSLSGDVGNPGQFVSVAACPTGSCCVAGVCADLTKDSCVVQRGLYLGYGTACSTHPCPPPSQAEMRITEFMYSGAGGEFVEFTNLGAEPVDMAGWSFTDSANLPGAVILSGFGVVPPGESAVLAEEPADEPGYNFLADWGLAGVQTVILGEGELGRNDDIYLYDSSGTLVDHLQYGDEDFPGSIRTQGVSGWPCAFGLGQNNIYLWLLSAGGDVQGSMVSSRGDIGSPGSYVPDCCGQAGPGDFDCDGDVDLEDFLTLAACLEGPGIFSAPICTPSDLDADGDVDLEDGGIFQSLFNGG